MDNTLVIIKPDAVKRNIIGKILTIFEEQGFIIREAKMLRLTKEEAESFYEVHKDKPFFNPLIEYITSGKVLVCVLEGKDAVYRVREIMGATDPKEAEEGTIRKLFGINKQENSVHGSDSDENALREISFFFK
ncbi:MAG: nucleoside-diphosphate kinase [Candidatus Hydrogenedentota bacterium]